MDYTDILINIRKLVRSLNLESKRIQKKYGISIPQLLCLKLLSERPDYQATVTEIAKYLNLNLSTSTGIVKRLEKKGYLARLPKKDDKRITPIALTSSGASLLQNSPELIHSQLTHKLKNLPPDKIDQIKNALETLVNYLDIKDVDASPLITIEEPIITLEDPDNNIPKVAE